MHAKKRTSKHTKIKKHTRHNAIIKFCKTPKECHQRYSFFRSALAPLNGVIVLVLGISSDAVLFEDAPRDEGTGGRTEDEASAADSNRVPRLPRRFLLGSREFRSQLGVFRLMSCDTIEFRLVRSL
eukprot:763634_1